MGNLFGKSSQHPPSNPLNWPDSTEEDLLDRPKRIVKVGSEQAFSFCNNFVKTSKYEVWDFLPKFLFDEFNPKHKVANCYFLMISALQVVPAISNTGGLPTTLIPLLFVVIVDGIFQVFEDIGRHRADTAANSSKSIRYNPETQRWAQCLWSEIVVGDFIKINTREMIPSDVIIISCAEKSTPPTGLCYVETKSLDGETNLKIRSAVSATMAKVTILLV
jgi:phospholipid-transporting ATPase